MSFLRPNLPRRGRVQIFGTFMFLIVMVVTAPGLSSARAAVKQFSATISPATAAGQVSGSWTEAVKNCGAAAQAPCTASSTIALGTIQIAVPTEFRPINSVTASSPTGSTTRNWTVSYDSSTGRINGFANSGTDKLQPGESILITFSATPSTCATGTKTFTTSAWGSTPSPGTDPFSIVGAQPTVTINGCGVTAGETVTDPSTDLTVSGAGFVGTVIVSFGPIEGGISCSTDPTYGAQWSSYHLPNQVNIDPSGVTSTTVKTFTFTFTGSADSSSYLICYATPNGPFTTRSGVSSPQVGDLFVGVLPNCYPGAGEPLNDPPCVDQQYKDLTTGKVVISIRVTAEDPHAR
jgi:hypothetical protein